MSKQGEKDASVDTHDLVLVTDASTQSSLIQKLTKVEQKLPSPTPPNSGYNSDASTIIIPEDKYNPDITRFDTPTNPSTHEATVTSPKSQQSSLKMNTILMLQGLIPLKILTREVIDLDQP